MVVVVDGQQSSVQGSVQASERPVAASPLRPRLPGLDRLRGLAVVCMVLDHVALFAGLDGVRWTVGRLAMPLFFVLGGALVRRLTWRYLTVFGAGLALTAVVPWIDSPNVLEWYALGAVVVLGVGRWVQGPAGPALLIGACLTLLANGLGAAGSGYPWPALWALMALGALLGRYRLALLGSRLPRALAPVGRWPLSIYCGHVLVVELVRRLVS